MKSPNRLPIVVTHFGGHSHVVTCLKETARRNRDIYLIGDPSNRHLWNEIPSMQWVDYRELPLDPEFADFKKCFVNYSTNPYLYELRCFLRMFYTRSLLASLDVEACFHLDSDCMLLTNIASNGFDKPDALSVYSDFGDRWRMAASVHNARLTRGFLDRFVELCLDVFVVRTAFALIEGKIRWHRENNIPGGICDMTLYYILAQTMNLQNLGQPRDGCVFDYMFGSGEGHESMEQYQMINGHKALKRVGDAIYITNSAGSLVRLLSIHLQGKSKLFINELSQVRDA